MSRLGGVIYSLHFLIEMQKCEVKKGEKRNGAFTCRNKMYVILKIEYSFVKQK